MTPPASRDTRLDRVWPAAVPLSAASFGEILEAIRPWIHKALLDGPGWKRVLAFTRGLPADAASYLFGFEYPLQRPAPDADLSIAVWLHTPIARHYISRGKAADADAAEAALAQVLVESERTGSFLSRVIGGAMVEYDLSTDAAFHSPGIFLASPKFWDPASSGYTNPGVLTAALAAATGQPECDEQRQVVEKLFDALPAGARIPHAGAFPGRGSRAIRLLIANVKAADLPGMMEHINWPGSADAVSATVSEFCDLTPYITASLDIGPGGVSPRLGLEMFQVLSPIQRLHSNPEVWHRFIDRLVERDLCLPGKAAGLRETARAETISDPAGDLRVSKGINHFKIALDGDHVEAKAYAFFNVRPLLTAVDVLRIFD